MAPTAATTGGKSTRCHMPSYSGASLTQWILTLVLGVSVGLIAFVMKQGIEELQLAKVSAIERLLNPCAESAAACEFTVAPQPQSDLQTFSFSYTARPLTETPGRMR